MDSDEKEQCKKELQTWLVKWTGGCAIQADGWPCGTCTISLLQELGLKEVGQHNYPPDVSNEVWRAILQIREEPK